MVLIYHYSINCHLVLVRVGTFDGPSMKQAEEFPFKMRKNWKGEKVGFRQRHPG